MLFGAGFSIVHDSGTVTFSPPQRTTHSPRRVVAESIRTQLPSGGCVASRNLGEAQRALFAYFAGLRTEREEAGRGEPCRLLLVQLGRNDIDAPPPEGMTPLWEGQRRGDASEKFVLYRKAP